MSALVLGSRTGQACPTPVYGVKVRVRVRVRVSTSIRFRVN